MDGREVDMGTKIIKKVAFTMVVIGLGPLLTGGCANSSKEEEEVEKVKPSRYLDSLCGKVNSYELSTGIVLIQVYGKVDPESPDVYLTRGEGGSVGTLRLTGQANRHFVAAERLSGSVAVGDAVYRRRLNPEFEEENREREIPLSIDRIQQETTSPERPELPFQGGPLDRVQ